MEEQKKYCSWENYKAFGVCLQERVDDSSVAGLGGWKSLHRTTQGLEYIDVCEMARESKEKWVSCGADELLEITPIWVHLLLLKHIENHLNNARYSVTVCALKAI